MIVFGTEGDRLVDTGYRVYRSVIPTQKLLDAGVSTDVSQVQARVWMGRDKVHHNVASFLHDDAKAAEEHRELSNCE